MNELALFAGAGGGILGGRLLGWRTVCAVEINTYCARRLLQRQNEGHLPPFPVWDDVCTFDGHPWRGVVDVVSGGFPCQDISSAGGGAGIGGERSGLWREFARIIEEVRPRYAFIENSPWLRTRGLVRVLKDLARLGYDAAWGVLGASDVGAPHHRRRMWIVAYASEDGHVADTYNGDERDLSVNGEVASESGTPCDHWWSSERGLGRVANGVAHRVDRLRAIGNGQVPAVAAAAWRALTERLTAPLATQSCK